jgi:hypothetical protein
VEEIYFLDDDDEEEEDEDEGYNDFFEDEPELRDNKATFVPQGEVRPPPKPSINGLDEMRRQLRSLTDRVLPLPFIP